MRFAILTLVAGALGLLCVTPPAWAEKGVKKNTTGEHTVNGVIVSVEHDKKGGHGSFVVKSHQGKKKNAAQAAAGQAGQGGKEHKVHVGKNTKFESGSGAKEHMVDFSHLKAGEHVTVHLKGDNAEKVVIHHRAKGQKKPV
jgi:hypothetical protein